MKERKNRGKVSGVEEKVKVALQIDSLYDVRNICEDNGMKERKNRGKVSGVEEKVKVALQIDSLYG
ncbi:hypothetical protein M514_28185, partial [Trichuris suis]